MRNQIRAKELKIYVLCLLKYSRISLTKKNYISWPSSSFATHVSFNVYYYSPPRACACPCVYAFVPFLPFYGCFEPDT